MGTHGTERRQEWLAVRRELRHVEKELMRRSGELARQPQQSLSMTPPVTSLARSR